MDIHELLKSSWDDVVKAGLPERLHEVGFREAVRLRSADTLCSDDRPFRQASPQLKRHGGGKDDASGESTDELVDAVAAYTVLANEAGIVEDELREVLHFDERGAVEVLAPGRKLGKDTATKARNVAILIAGARFVVHKQRAVPVDLVREACIDRGCYDSKNFTSSHLGKFDARNVRSNDVVIKPSRWLAAFKAAVATARGIPGSAE